MYCNNCGNQIDDNAAVCIHCGAPTQNFSQPAQQQQQQPAQSNTMALVGFILAFLMPLIGLILSIIGLKRAPEYNGNGKGLATAGIIIGAIETLIVAIVIIVEIVAIVSMVGAAGSMM